MLPGNDRQWVGSCCALAHSACDRFLSRCATFRRMSTPPPPEPGQGYGPPPPSYGYGQPPPEDNVWSVLVHLSTFVFPLLAPLILFLIVKSDPRKPMTRHHAAEALNFHLSLTLYFIVATLLAVGAIGLVATGEAAFGLAVISGLLILAVYIVSIVLTIIAAVAAGKRQPYRYPMTIRVVH